MALKIHGQHDLLFEFWKESSRDEVIRRIQDLPFSSGTNTPSFSEARPTLSPVSSSDGQKHPADILAPPKEILFTPRAFPDEALSYMPFIANKPWQSVARLTPRHFICLTIGSRGDVQPYIALGLRLMKDGHRVTIVTHSECTLATILMYRRIQRLD
jgi:sterol 3beta-glucosyltransferase